MNDGLMEFAAWAEPLVGLVVAKVQAMTWVQILVVGMLALSIVLLVTLDRKVQRVLRHRRNV